MKANATIRNNLAADEKAVSPVVATLLLVLVAAGAAIGFGVFLNGFQTDTQDNVSTESPKTELRIGGSSTVYELSKAAESDFERAHPSIDLVIESGGSGAGKSAVCRGFIDIGSSSSAWKQSETDVCEDKLGVAAEIVTVAKDGFAFPIGSGNAHCTAMAFTKAQITALYNRNGRAVGAAGQNVEYPATGGGLLIPIGTTPLTWTDLKTAGSCTGAGGVETVVLGARSDPGGTEDGFRSYFGLAGTSDGQLDDTIYTELVNSDGNQGMEDFLVGNNDALSFLGYGFVAVNPIDLPVVATLDGVTISAANIKSGAYGGVRDLTYGTAGPPSALEQMYLDFVTNTHNNQIFSTAAGYVSIY